MWVLITLITVLLFYLSYKHIDIPKLLLGIMFTIFFSSLLLYCVDWKVLMDFFSPLTQDLLVKTFIQGYTEEVIKFFSPLLAIIIYSIYTRKNNFEYFIPLYFLSTVSFILVENYLYYISFATSANPGWLWVMRSLLCSWTHLLLFSIVVLCLQNMKITPTRVFLALLISW